MAETEEKPKGPYFHELKDEQVREQLLKWWQSISEVRKRGERDKPRDVGGRGERAELRRAETPMEILPAKAFHRLCWILPWWANKDDNLLALAIVAGILAHVETAGHGSFPRQLGTPKEGSDKAIFSELRFQQLLSSENHNEFYQRLRRAVQLVGGTADICLLADGILHWAKDRQDSSAEKPSQRFRYTWAKDYFTPTLHLSKEPKP